MSQQQDLFLGPFHLSHATVISRDKEDTRHVTMFSVLRTFTV